MLTSGVNISLCFPPICKAPLRWSFADNSYGPLSLGVVEKCSDLFLVESRWLWPPVFSISQGFKLDCFRLQRNTCRSFLQTLQCFTSAFVNFRSCEDFLKRFEMVSRAKTLATNAKGCEWDPTWCQGREEIPACSPLSPTCELCHVCPQPSAQSKET